MSEPDNKASTTGLPRDYRQGNHNTVGSAAFEANLECIKGTVQCDQVAEEETVLKQSGPHLRGLCPLPDHNGDSPSFYCYDNGQGFYDKWYCHRCGKGGDVLDLYGLMHGLDHSLKFTLDALAERYGIQLWRETDLMSDSQMMARRARIRAEKQLQRGFAEHLFREWFKPYLMTIEDKEERAQKLLELRHLCGLDNGGDGTKLMRGLALQGQQAKQEEDK